MITRRSSSQFCMHYCLKNAVKLFVSRKKEHNFQCFNYRISETKNIKIWTGVKRFWVSTTHEKKFANYEKFIKT